MHANLIKWLEKHQSGDIEAANTYYLAHVNEFPDDVDAWQLLGITYGQLNQLDQALNAFKKGLDIDPTNTALHNNIGHVYIKLEAFEKGEYHFNEVLRQSPSHFGVLNNLGLLHYKQANFDVAESYFHKALLIDEKNESALCNLGLCQFNQRQLKTAIRTFHAVFQLNSLNHPAVTKLAECYLQQSSYHNAIKYFKKARKIEATFQIHHGLGCAYLGINQLQSALDCFNAAYDIEPFNFENCHNIASVYFHQRKLGEALQCWFQCLQMQPTSEETIYNIAVVYQYQNKFDDASDYFHKVLVKNPNHIDSLHNLGTLCLKQNNQKGAIGFYQRVKKLDPNNEQITFLLSALEQNNQDHFKQCPETYVKQLFDDYAPTYDEHLTKVLRYNGHEQLCDLIEAALEPKKDQWDLVMDIGCGTGLAGSILRPWAKKLIGVDCASNMLLLAKKTQYYDELIEGFLPDIDWPEENISLCFMADCMPYFGELSPLIQSMYDAGSTKCIIACSIEQACDDCEQYELSPSGRYRHNPEYLITTMKAFKFNLLKQKQTTIRYEQHHPVKNHLFVFRRII